MVNNKRKNEHVALTELLYKEHQHSDFDDLHYIHHSLPEVNLCDIDISTRLATYSINQPFFINAMTGGTDITKKINEKLAIVVRETGLVIATGSLSAVLKDSYVESSFRIIREINPKGIIFANIGAGQTVENAQKVIDLIDANALQVHLNAPQELIMPDGDKDFKGWLSNIEKMVSKISIPIIVKEVGFGMSSRTIKQLIDIGVKYIDISGKGGTNFAKIENYRREDYKLSYLENWGQSTVASLLEAATFIDQVDIYASGGIRNPLDLVKALSLGAKAVGISGYFLHFILNKGIDETIKEIISWKEQIKTIMALLGKKTIKDLIDTDVLIMGNVRDYCISRGIDYLKYSKRL
ncbi:MAG TPA: type 2 isopentenyl-diphosphate Delta-isomerase [Haloplasmataceae bacterium]